MKHVSRSLEETGAIAREFLHTLEAGGEALVVSLEGDLGSGKTTFSQALGKALGVEDTMQSPTFVLEKIYPIDYKGFKKLIHIDAYRLEKESELTHLGWDEIVKDRENLILLEWPERVAGLAPKEARRITFKFIDETTREVSL